MSRPVTTLFMLMSADGKISTGCNDTLDFDRDLPALPGVREGLHQYYEIEQTTDLWSLNSGRVQEKMGVNEKPYPPKSIVSFVLVDNHHLTGHGVRYFCALSRQFVLITSNREHPAFRVQEENLHILYQERTDLPAALEYLYELGCERLTLQSGGTLNAEFLRAGLIDFVDLVVAPLLVGGRNTPTLVDGESISSAAELNRLGILKLQSAGVLEDSYLRLKYQVLQNREEENQ